jgi:predicted metal-dependent hydrolase
MNHSKEFWNLVGDVFPQYNQAESYLKEKGLALYKLD